MADKNGQLKYLKDRLDSLMRRKNVFWGDHSKVKLSKPPAVIAAEKQLKAAERVIKTHQKLIDKATERRNERRKADYEACRKEVFFGSPEKALKMLDQFEAKW